MTMKKDNLTVIAAEDHHLVRVAGNLRRQDKAELLASWTGDALTQFRTAKETGRVWAVVNPEGLAVAVGGIVPLPDEVHGVVWLMGTDELTVHYREFLRRCRSYIDALHEIRPILFNSVHIENTVHLRWLKWAGFLLLPEPQRVGKHGAVFRKFIRIK